MATAEQIRALLKSHIAGDETQFLSIALQVAAHEAKQGHAKIARELQAMIDQARSNGHERKESPSPVPIAQPRGELVGLIHASYPNELMAEMVLSDEVRSRLRRVLTEHRQADKLLMHGLVPRRKLLLVGPPGTGKTMTANVLAGELRLPLFTVLIDGVLSKFLGESAAKLRLVFESFQKTRGVYFFDEFDALGTQRLSANDVGEMRRVLNSFLQFLEQDTSTSLVLAATNHLEVLDRALFRRFDDVVRYSLPDDLAIQATIENRLAAFDTTTVDWSAVVESARGRSHADVVRASVDAAKTAVLDGSELISTEHLLGSLREQTA